MSSGRSSAGAIPLVLLAFCLGTLGSFSVGFGIGTACTTALDASSTGSGPCQRVETAMAANAVGQFVLVAAGVWLRGRVRSLAAWWALTAISLAWFAVAAWYASRW